MTAPPDGEIAPGEIVLEGVSRSFSMRADKGRTLKELFVDRRDAGGPAPIQALRDVSLHIQPGETVGLIGRNGAGKSSTLRLLAGIIPPDRGVVRCGGRIQTLLELGSGFSRDFTGRENIYLNGALHGLSKADIEERIDRIIAFADLGDFIEAPVKTYSSGMFVRLGFAIAGHLDADVLLIDELLAVGDEAFQRKCMRRIAERIEEGATLVLVSHAAAAIERICERVLVLDGGELVFDGPSPEGLLHYHRLLGTERPDSTPVPRLGEAPFEIAELELQDGKGRRSDVFRTGEALRVALTLKATRPAADPLLQLELRDPLGRRLYTSETAPALGAGPARLAFRVPRLALLGGDYEVVVSAREAGAADAPSYDRVMGFNVVDRPDATGVLDLQGTWSSVEPAEIAERLRVARLSSSGADGGAVQRASPVVGGGEAEDASPRRPAGTLAVSPGDGNESLGPALPLTRAKELVQEFYDRAINGRDASVCGRLLTDDFVHNGDRRGARGQQQAIQVFLDAFSPLRHELLIVFAEGDLVCARQRWSGTHVGEFFGQAGTDRHVSFTSTAILKVRDGRIAEVWEELDAAGLLHQLI